jgi:hypothetical protein
MDTLDHGEAGSPARPKVRRVARTASSNGPPPLARGSSGGALARTPSGGARQASAPPVAASPPRAAVPRRRSSHADAFDPMVQSRTLTPKKSVGSPRRGGHADKFDAPPVEMSPRRSEPVAARPVAAAAAHVDPAQELVGAATPPRPRRRGPLVSPAR